MNQLLEYKTSSQNLINQANEFIDEFFFEEELKVYSSKYISHKFNQSTYFSYLTTMHYDIFRTNPSEEEKIHIATIIELIVLASDIMDDLQDDDSGGNPWADVSLGKNLNIIIGMLLICLSKIENIPTAENSKKWIREKTYQYALKSINGQHIDLKNQILSEQDYLLMVSLKSGALIKMACLLGTGYIDRKEQEIIENYCNHLGVIAQIRNDVNDMVNGFIKSDIMYKKRTLPILYYLNGKNPEFQIIKDYYFGNQSYNEMTDQQIDKFHETLINGGGIEYCKVLEQLYLYKFEKCVQDLNIDPHSKEKILNIKI